MSEGGEIRMHIFEINHVVENHLTKWKYNEPVIKMKLPKGTEDNENSREPSDCHREARKWRDVVVQCRGVSRRGVIQCPAVERYLDTSR